LRHLAGGEILGPLRGRFYVWLKMPGKSQAGTAREEGLYYARSSFRTLRRTETLCAGCLCRCYHNDRETAPGTVRLLRAADRHSRDLRVAGRHREARGRGDIPGERRGRGTLHGVRHTYPTTTVAPTRGGVRAARLTLDEKIHVRSVAPRLHWTRKRRPGSCPRNSLSLAPGRGGRRVGTSTP